jgi:lactate dehydrogenase-like 2-hydroxyacid dehydrogenase
LGIVGYGDLGNACAKIAKLGFNMRVIGTKKSPSSISTEYLKYIDKLTGED